MTRVAVVAVWWGGSQLLAVATGVDLGVAAVVPLLVVTVLAALMEQALAALKGQEFERASAAAVARG